MSQPRATLEQQMAYLLRLKHRLGAATARDGHSEVYPTMIAVDDADREFVEIIHQTLLVFQVEGADDWVRAKRGRRGRR